ncbi:1-acyl-sn-glycerol-3-phosphate acyltransferase [Allomuricauda sp. d1]|uniref:1-acyl-sn-glycerol-3-phosphate acyltransferase n=1 Tax=Allomuricauda sp. d1 TaxID=3136725 RepID=UPI0031D13B6A
MRQLAKFIYFRVMGWKLVGHFPDVDKCVVIVVPHTHWHDFPLGLIIRKIMGKDIHYIAKKSLFKPPFGFIFKSTGGTPVDRSRNNNFVEAVADIFKKHKVFRLALAPEGTRKKVSALKTGFYYIAKSANVPIVMVAFDFGKKEVKISQPFHPTENKEEDFQTIHAFFKGVVGRVPEYSF